MPFRTRYADLNRRCKEAIEEAERAARELNDYFAAAVYQDPVTRIDPTRLAEMRQSLQSALAGLADRDPSIRLAAVSLFGTKLPPQFVAKLSAGHREPDYEYPPEAAEAMLALATSDPDDEVRQSAMAVVPQFFRGERRDRTVEKRLAEFGLETDNVIVRHHVFLGLMWMSGVPHSLLMSPKYLGLPIIFDESYVRLFLEPSTSPDPILPVTQPRQWWRFGKR